MRLRHVLALEAALLLGTVLAISCANPLETTSDSTPEPFQTVDTLFVTDTLLHMDTMFVSDSTAYTDTVYVIDSTSFTDTVYVVDTLTQVDTVVLSDTVLQIDTVSIQVPDTSGCDRLCAQLSSHQPVVVWLLDNAPGLFFLKFVVAAERDQPLQTLVVEIDGATYGWPAQENSEFTVDAILDADARILVSLDNPKALGHSIAVCVTLTPL